MRPFRRKRDSRYFNYIENGENRYSRGNYGKMKKRKPCYICGDIEHLGKFCKQVTKCLICLRKGHLVVDCPCKNEEVDSGSRFCLKCGGIGHDMFSCSNDYNSEDLKDIHCYVCGKLGHLCCVESKIDRLREASCYSCGRSGHFGGSDCVKLSEVVIDLQSEQLCSEGGSKDHFPQACVVSDLQSEQLCSEGGSKDHVPQACVVIDLQLEPESVSKDHFPQACTEKSKVGQDALAANSAKDRKPRRRKKNKAIPTVNASQSGTSSSNMAHTRSLYAVKFGSTTSRESINQKTRELLHAHQTKPTVSNMAHTRSLYAVKFGSPTTARDSFNHQTSGLLLSHQNYNNQVRTQVPRNISYPMTQLEHQHGTQHAQHPTHHHVGVQPPQQPTHHHIGVQPYTRIYQDSFYPMAPRPHLSWNGLRGTQIPQQPLIHQTENLFQQPNTQVYRQPINHQIGHMYPRPAAQIQQPVSYPTYPTGNIIPQARSQYNQPPIDYTTRILLPHQIRAPVLQNVVIRVEHRPPFPNHYN